MFRLWRSSTIFPFDTIYSLSQLLQYLYSFMITRALILDIYIRTAAVCLVINIHIMMMNLQCLSVQTVIICEDKHKQLFNFDERFHEKKCWQWGAAVWGGPLNTKPNIYSFYPLIAIDGSKDLSLYYNSYPKQFNPSC